jgi:hypothetical protein
LLFLNVVTFQKCNNLQCLGLETHISCNLPYSLLPDSSSFLQKKKKKLRWQPHLFRNATSLKCVFHFLQSPIFLLYVLIAQNRKIKKKKESSRRWCRIHYAGLGVLLGSFWASCGPGCICLGFFRLVHKYYKGSVWKCNYNYFLF